MKSKIKIGDNIQVIKGKNLGKTGKVKKVFTDTQKILVDSINIVKKHVKPSGGKAGGIFEIEKPLSIANVQILCPFCKKRTKIGIQIKDAQKQRICKKCGAVIEFKKETKAVAKPKKTVKTKK